MAEESGLGKLLGKGSIFEQILVWQVLGQVLSSVLGPESQLLANAANSITQAVPLSPAVLADMVVRNILSQDQAADVARKSGIAPSDFARLVEDTGEAPPTEMLLEAFRRQIITWSGEGGDLPSATRGLLQGRLKDEWIPLILEMATVPIPVADAVDAVIEGQISYQQGETIAYQNGFKPEDFRILVDTRGNPPDPTQLGEMVRRGIIPMQGTGPSVTSFEQGIHESAWKDKWEPAFERLIETIPPPRTVTALERAGAITKEQAITLYRQAGLSADLAEAYSSDASHQKLAADKQLAKADVLELYQGRAISAQQCTDMLGLLGYSAEEAKLLQALQDVRLALQQEKAAIARLQTLYVSRKIGKQDVVGALDALHVPSDQREQLLLAWDVERASNVKVLTQAEVAAAFHYKIIEQGEAITELVASGYTPRDAWIILSVREHAKLPNPPAPGLVG